MTVMVTSFWYPAGAFRMGDNFGDGESRERPAHVVDLDAF